jgi:outer membrane protein W
MKCVLLVVVVGLWLAPYAEAQGWVEAHSDLVPTKGSYALTVGPALVSGKAKAKVGSASAQTDTETSYGGFLAFDYFVRDNVALQLSFTAVSEAFDELADVYAVGGGVKIYMRSDNLFQPFFIAGIEGLFFDVDFAGADIDPAVAARVGGGLDVLLSPRLDMVLSAEFFHTITDTDLKISGGSADLQLWGLLAKVGLRYKF